MKNKVETPIYLVTADVYLRFPEIMEEEYKDLLEYLDDEHILYERCTREVNDLQNKVQQLETNIAEAIKLLLDNTADYTDGDFEGMRFQNDIVKILERGKENE